MSNHFTVRNGELFAEDVALTDIATEHGTPTFVYSQATLEQHYRAWKTPLGDRGDIYYAVKANSNLGVLSVLAKAGSGFDIVSAGELYRVISAGGDPAKVVFSGVGKTAEEMIYALESGIHCFNVESRSELHLLNDVAASLSMVAPISLRVNPDVDAKTHPYISTGLKENKFGIDINDAIDVYRTAQKLAHIRITGVDCHIGSQLTELKPYWDALDRILVLVDKLSDEGIELDHIDLGGGLGVVYKDEQPPLPKAMLEGIFERLGDRKHRLAFEPGRSIAANAGILLTKTLFLKETPDKNFAIVDAAMNDLIRPALYDAWMDASTVKSTSSSESSAPVKHWDIVGPICESGDFLAKDRALALNENDLIAIHSAGAYGYTMSSNYNSRCRAAEIMVSGNQATLVRKRETLAQLISGESTV